MLDLACDIASDKADTALNVWEAVEHDIVGHSTVKWMAQVDFRACSDEPPDCVVSCFHGDSCHRQSC